MRTRKLHELAPVDEVLEILNTGGVEERIEKAFKLATYAATGVVGQAITGLDRIPVGVVKMAQQIQKEYEDEVS